MADNIQETPSIDNLHSPKEASVEEKLPSVPQVEESHSAVVAAHYNALEEKGLSERNKSRIVHLRNFNNWIKSTLINEFIEKVRSSTGVGSSLRVLDIGCGKGGDLLKWRNGNISHLVCADIANTSVEQCRSRYEDVRARSRHQRVFSAEFIVADCTKERLREKYKDASMRLDLVSCQFSFHYSFESLPQAECMLRNAAECLRPGGYFIGTIPDANDIVARRRTSGVSIVKNAVCAIRFEEPLVEPPPLFGAKYGFSLDGVVDCPEFLVHFPTLERLARRYGLELVMKSRFEEYFEKNKEKGRGLLGRMQAFETYPAFEGTVLNGEDIEYDHAKQFLENKSVSRVGTLSRPEWEAASLYLVFAFRKMKPVSIDSHGRPIYEMKNGPTAKEPCSKEKQTNSNPEEIGSVSTETIGSVGEKEDSTTEVQNTSVERQDVSEKKNVEKRSYEEDPMENSPPKRLRDDLSS